MLIKMWAFALVLALAAMPVAFSLAAGSDPADAGPHPQEGNATAGTAAAGTSTPSGKTEAEAVNAGRKADSESTRNSTGPASK